VRGLESIAAAIIGAALRRPRAAIAGAVVLVLLAALGLTRLQTDTGARTLVGGSSPSAAATDRAQRLFGGDAIVIAIAGDVSHLVLTSDLERVLGLEGCLAGKQAAAGGACARLAALGPAHAVIGPGTFINTAADELSTQLERRLTAARTEAAQAAKAAAVLARRNGWSDARVRAAADAARRIVIERATVDLIRTGVRFGVLRAPTINDQNFVSRLVFEPGVRAGTPKARFAYLFPTRNVSLVTVRLRSGLDEAERSAAIADIRAAVAMPAWRLQGGGRYSVTGAPVVLSDLTGAVQHQLVRLSLLALIVMALVLGVVFPVRRRLLPLVVATAGVAVAFGALSAAGAPVTIAAVAVAPILLGLIVDYALQLQARARDHGGPRDEALAALARSGAPAIVAAALTTAAGFLALLISPVPMVRGFALLLIAGVLIGLAGALLLVPAVLSLGSGVVRPRAGALAASLRGAGSLVRDNPLTRALRRSAVGLREAALAVAGRRPRRLLALTAIVAVAGFGAELLVPVQADVTQLAPQDLASLEALRSLQHETGVAGQIDVLVEGRNLTDPAIVRWMSDAQRRILARAGYGPRRGCGRADLCPAFSLPDLLSRLGAKPTKTQIDGLLAAIPASFSRNVITADRRAATLAFGIRLMDLGRQSDVIAMVRRELRPPAGVRATLVGLPVLAADAGRAVASPLRRLLTTLAGLLLVAGALRLLLGAWRRALVPLVPIVLATGIASLVVLATGVALNPMSVTLGALVPAIATEFSVVLAERRRGELAGGLDAAAALRRAYATTGSAVLASAATAIAGFLVLVAGTIPMLRDFGIVTVIDLTIAVAAVLLLLPAAVAVFAAGGRDDR